MTEKKDVLDLDAARAAEADASRRPLTVKVGGKSFTVNRPLPLAVAFAAAELDWKGIVEAMFDGQVDAVLAAGLTMDDLTKILDRVAGGPGKSKASPGSSRTAGRNSKPTSRRTTASTRRSSPADDS